MTGPVGLLRGGKIGQYSQVGLEVLGLLAKEVGIAMRGEGGDAEGGAERFEDLEGSGADATGRTQNRHVFWGRNSHR